MLHSYPCFSYPAAGCRDGQGLAIALSPADSMLHINFDTFFELTRYFRRTEGFTKEETENFEALYDKYDYSRNGELDARELGTILLHLG